MAQGGQTRIEDLGKETGGGKPGEKERSSGQRSTDRTESNLRGRLVECFDRIAGSLEQRGDNQLAEIIREDGAVMAQGLVSLTRPFRVLRGPLLILVAVIEPFLAFGRIVRVLLTRWRDRRYEAAQEAEAEAEHEPGITP